MVLMYLEDGVGTMVKSKIIYELPVYSSSLEQDPIFQSKDMNMEIELIGVDEENKLRRIVIRFNSVLCHKYTLARMMILWQTLVCSSWIALPPFIIPQSGAVCCQRRYK